jgi:hypothetical protein
MSKDINENYIENSKWKITSSGDWKLFFDTNSASQADSNENKFTIPTNSKLKLGSLVMTPDGVGRLTNLDDVIAEIKFTKNEEKANFNKSLIKSDFNVLIKIYGGVEINNWYRLIIPANGNVEILKESIQKLKIVSQDVCYNLIYDGLELQEGLYFDQLDKLRDNCKILLIQTEMNKNKIVRYNSLLESWDISNVDGLTFTVDKKIHLAGLGMYASYTGSTLMGAIRVYKGNTSDRNEVLHEEDLTISSVPDKANAIQPVNFKRRVPIQAGEDYTIEFAPSRMAVKVYYGAGGLPVMLGEKNVTFNFKYIQRCNYMTYIEDGIFPEIYYSV